MAGGLRSGGSARWLFTREESARILPQTAIVVSREGVVTADAGTTVDSWAARYGGLTWNPVAPAATNRPAWSAAGGPGGQPMITGDGVDNVIEAAITKGSQWDQYELGAVLSRVAPNVTDAWLLFHFAGSFVAGIRDQPGNLWHMTSSTTTAIGTSNPTGAWAHWNGSMMAAEVSARRGATLEAQNLSGASGLVSDGITGALFGRISGGQYGNVSMVAAHVGVKLTPAQRLYLNALLFAKTGVVSA